MWPPLPQQKNRSPVAADCGYYGPIPWRLALSQSAHCHRLSPYNNEASPSTNYLATRVARTEVIMRFNVRIVCLALIVISMLSFSGLAQPQVVNNLAHFFLLQ